MFVNQKDINIDETGLVKFCLDNRFAACRDFALCALPVIAFPCPAEEKSVRFLIAEFGFEGINHFFARFVGKRGFIGFPDNKNICRIEVGMAASDSVRMRGAPEQAYLPGFAQL